MQWSRGLADYGKSDREILRSHVIDLNTKLMSCRQILVYQLAEAPFSAKGFSGHHPLGEEMAENAGIGIPFDKDQFAVVGVKVAEFDPTGARRKHHHVPVARHKAGGIGSGNSHIVRSLVPILILKEI
jgi:hypothetical protein